MWAMGCSRWGSGSCPSRCNGPTRASAGCRRRCSGSRRPGPGWSATLGARGPGRTMPVRDRLWRNWRRRRRRGPSRLLKKSLALGDEARVVAIVDEDVAHEASSGPQGHPAATADGIAFVEALPRELGAGSTVARAVADIKRGAEPTVRHVAVCRTAEADVGRLGNVEVTACQHIHLGDPPAALEDGGEGGLAPHGPAPCANSFGRRMRL